MRRSRIEVRESALGVLYLFLERIFIAILVWGACHKCGNFPLFFFPFFGMFLDVVFMRLVSAQWTAFDASSEEEMSGRELFGD